MEKNIYLDSPINEEINIIIPTRNLNELSKLLDDSENDAEIHVYEIEDIGTLLSHYYTTCSDIILSD